MSPDGQYFDSSVPANKLTKERIQSFEQNSPHFPASMIMINEDESNSQLRKNGTEVSEYDSKSQRLSVLNANFDDTEPSHF
jgi:hypothetical protein